MDKLIEQGVFREIQAREIGSLNGEPIECSTLTDEPVIKANKYGRNSNDNKIIKLPADK